jgi:hypothetical protein
MNRKSENITDANQIAQMINHFTDHELGNANRSKHGRAVQKLIEAGVEFKIEVCEAGRSYKLTDKYRSAVVVRIGDKMRTLLIKDMRSSSTSVSVDNIAKYPQRYKLIEGKENDSSYYVSQYNGTCFSRCSKDTEGAIEYKEVMRTYCLNVEWRRIAAHLFQACKGIITTEKSTCAKCCGEGRISGFMHVENGICFDCWGTGGDIVLTQEFKQELKKLK